MADVQLQDYQHLFAQHTDDSFVDEVTRRPTVPSGTYRATIDQIRVYEKGTDERFPKRLDRQYAVLSFPIKNGEDRKIGRFDFDVSWEMKRTDSGRPDSLAVAFNSLKGALGLKGQSDGDVLKTASEQPLDFVLREIYRDEKGAWLDIGGDDDRKMARDKGLRIINTLQGVRKAV